MQSEAYEPAKSIGYEMFRRASYVGNEQSILEFLS